MLREGAVYAVAGLQPRPTARRGLELNANSSVVWQPVTNLGDRRAVLNLGFVCGLYLTSQSCMFKVHKRGEAQVSFAMVCHRAHRNLTQAHHHAILCLPSSQAACCCFNIVPLHTHATLTLIIMNLQQARWAHCRHVRGGETRQEPRVRVQLGARLPAAARPAAVGRL